MLHFHDSLLQKKEKFALNDNKIPDLLRAPCVPGTAPAAVQHSALTPPSSTWGAYLAGEGQAPRMLSAQVQPADCDSAGLSDSREHLPPNCMSQPASLYHNWGEPDGLGTVVWAHLCPPDK